MLEVVVTVQSSRDANITTYSFTSMFIGHAQRCTRGRISEYVLSPPRAHDNQGHGAFSSVCALLEFAEAPTCIPEAFLFC